MQDAPSFSELLDGFLYRDRRSRTTTYPDQATNGSVRNAATNAITTMTNATVAVADYTTTPAPAPVPSKASVDGSAWYHNIER